MTEVAERLLRKASRFPRALQIPAERSRGPTSRILESDRPNVCRQNPCISRQPPRRQPQTTPMQPSPVSLVPHHGLSGPVHHVREDASMRITVRRSRRRPSAWARRWPRRQLRPLTGSLLALAALDASAAAAQAAPVTFHVVNAAGVPQLSYALVNGGATSTDGAGNITLDLAAGQTVSFTRTVGWSAPRRSRTPRSRSPPRAPRAPRPSSFRRRPARPPTRSWTTTSAGSWARSTRCGRHR
jgi:hypothetical protein